MTMQSYARYALTTIHLTMKHFFKIFLENQKRLQLSDSLVY